MPIQGVTAFFFFILNKCNRFCISLWINSEIKHLENKQNLLCLASDPAKTCNYSKFLTVMTIKFIHIMIHCIKNGLSFHYAEEVSDLFPSILTTSSSLITCNGFNTMKNFTRQLISPDSKDHSFCSPERLARDIKVCTTLLPLSLPPSIQSPDEAASGTLLWGMSCRMSSAWLNCTASG